MTTGGVLLTICNVATSQGLSPPGTPQTKRPGVAEGPSLGMSRLWKQNWEEDCGQH